MPSFSNKILEIKIPKMENVSFKDEKYCSCEKAPREQRSVAHIKDSFFIGQTK
jgi:hypothetical protein